MAPATVKKHLPVLSFLHKSSPTVRKQIIKGAKKPLIHCLCECAYNILYTKGLRLSSAKKRSLKKHAGSLRNLASRGSLASKKKILQKGGFLGSLLGAIVPVVSSLLGGVLGGRR